MSDEGDDGPTRRQLLGLIGVGGITAIGAGLIITGARVSPTEDDDTNNESTGGDQPPDEPSALSAAWDATYGDGPSAFSAAVGRRSVASIRPGGGNATDENATNAPAANATQNGTDGNATTGGTTNASDPDDGPEEVVFGGVRSTGENDSDGWLVGVEGPETTTFDTTYAAGDTEGGDGDRAFDAVECVLPATDGWVVVGWSHEPSPDDADAPDRKYPWATGVDDAGTSQWFRTYERSGVESYRDVFRDGVPTSDGGYLLAGVTLGASFDDVRRGDGWLAKIGAEGRLTWERTYAPDGADRATWSADERYDAFTTVRAVADGYLLAGAATTDGPSDSNPADGWLVGVDPAGGRRWASTYEYAGGEGSDSTDLAIADVRRSGDGFLAVGTAGSYEYVRPLRENQLFGDGWIAGLDGEGNVQWEQTVADAALRTLADAGDAGWVAAGARENQPWVGLLGEEGSLAEELTLSEADGVVSAATVRDDGAIALAGRRDDGETPVAFVTQLSPVEMGDGEE
ncbi:MAG TPA: hypothetical protein VKM69_01995 [Natronoarchaeum rubrum]|nr:hypothetical protein [Natronoarchaeum rubrum]